MEPLVKEKMKIRVEIISILLLILFSSNSIAQSKIENTGILKGVVTYYFNKNYGYKPDVGGTVYILSESKLDFITNGHTGSISWDTIASFDKVKLCMILKSYYSKSGELLSKDCDTTLKTFGISSDESYEMFVNRVSMNCMLFKDINKDTKVLSIDGSGNYSIQLPEGNYCIIIQSSVRKGLNKVEVRGKIVTKKVIINKNEETILNAKFELD